MQELIEMIAAHPELQAEISAAFEAGSRYTVMLLFGFYVLDIVADISFELCRFLNQKALHYYYLRTGNKEWKRFCLFKKKNKEEKEN